MENIWIPALIAVVVVLGGVFLMRSMRTTGGKKSETQNGATARSLAEIAHDAGARLSEEQHRTVYSLIAQGQMMDAIKFYYTSTKVSLRESRDAITALSTHPQPYRTPPASADVVPSGGGPERFAYRYRAIASKGDETREVSSNMLNDEIYTNIKELALAGDCEGAATMLQRHSEISLDEAREFISFLVDGD
ncbi:hypothetical protein ACQR35_13750 [Pseudarthrobacter sp. J1738]|uniref:hypothetical protein n=1 Tax=unclassified Pseudarthrobacter TaxID=2647000 RepID=UPI003D2C6B8A